jgi:hypothetical protein
MALSRFTLLLAFILLGRGSLCAQQPSASDTLDRIRPLPVTELDRLKEEASPPAEDDLGEITLVDRIQPPDMFTVFTTQSLFHTDNVRLANDLFPGLTSSGWLGRWGVSLVPYSTRHWTPAIQIAYEAVRYDEASVEDFNSQSITLGQRLNLTDDGAVYWAPTYALQRFERPRGDEEEFYKQGVLGNDIGWVKALGSGELGNLYLGTIGSVIWRHTNPSEFDRVSEQGFVSLIWLPFPTLRVQPYSNLSHYHYLTDTAFQTNRTDLTFSSGISVAWTPWKYLSLEAKFNHTINDSSEALADYTATTPAVSFSGVYSF